MTLNFEKSNFVQYSIKFLGFYLDKDGIRKDPEKINTILNFPTPRNPKQLKSFLGVCNCYSRFVRNYSSMLDSLLPLTSKKNKWIWGEVQQARFDEIKRNFSNEIILYYPDNDKEFYLRTNASNKAVGGILYQISDNNEEKVIFLNKSLKTSEKCIVFYELELYSVILALKKVTNYIYRNKIIIYTDNMAVTHISTCKFLNNRVMKWSLFLEQFNYKIRHITGKENRIADYLSRINLEE